MSVTLHRVTDLAPVAQLVVYAVMPGGAVVADSHDFPVQLCLNNKVPPQTPRRTSGDVRRTAPGGQSIVHTTEETTSGLHQVSLVRMVM
ncbi:Alpha-2-macroglobulin [Liparis tanakae]|uniref:Alpha-2-macroglobulin n=1 Tax=Liparis tanakae TaxID=230148 RepID=A0A4Z2E720_9TELE|nr:Alpha-2-macroglobulin [Liparis tanakae]